MLLVFFLINKMSASVYVLLFFCLQSVLSQGTGSGDNGSLRVCIVEGRGPYKRDQKYCPILDQEKSGVQCVLGKDRLDCLRRISKGTVDFGVFSPEDLMAAQWAELDVLVTSEIRQRPRPFARSIVAIVKKSILPDSSANIHAILKNRTLCLPGESTDELRPLSETLSGYLDTLITVRSCDPRLSSTENKLKSLADYYGKACKAGPWVPDPTRDAELKREFPSLCAACSGRSCSKFDPYYGAVGALTCLTEGEGDITWGEAADVAAFFKQGDPSQAQAISQNYAYLCRDGTSKGLNENPCVWLHRPWDIIVSKRKAAEEVVRLTNLLTNNTLTVDTHWKGSLIALLESNTGLTEPLRPPMTARDYLAKAQGFIEAYSQTGCDPPRHITLCTTSLLARNKCEWMSEGGSVYGIVPSIQCYVRENTSACLKAVADGQCDAAIGDSDDLIYAHGLSLKPLLHEITFKNLATKPIQDKTNTVFAYVKNDSGITKMADLRGKRAAFPRYNGATWHAVQHYITEHEKLTCKAYIEGYFGEICAPGMDGKNCYEAGETEALKSLLDGKSDVAFISKSTYNAYKVNNNVSEDKIIPICPEDNQKYCFLGWSNIGHIFTANNLTSVRQHEILNVFTKLDQIFGSSSPFHNPMFLMYAAYNHTLEVIFHSNTKKLASTDILKAHPYSKIPFNFELGITNVTDFTVCNFCAKVTPSIVVMIVTLVTFFVNS